MCAPLRITDLRSFKQWRDSMELIGDTLTSHCIFVRIDGKTLPAPARRPIKPIYVKKFLELVEGA